MTDERTIAGRLAANAAKIVTTERGQQHGDLEGSFTLIADWWNSYMHHKQKALGLASNFAIAGLDAVDVLEMMAMVKKARNVYGKPVPDHTIDDIGYTALAGGLRLRELVTAKEQEDVAKSMEEQHEIRAQGEDAVAAALGGAAGTDSEKQPPDTKETAPPDSESEPPPFSKRLVEALTPRRSQQ